MSKKTDETVQVLKIELGFDPAASKVLGEMRERSKTESNEKLISDALRVYDWYLQNKRGGLYTKRDDQWVKVDLQF